jgi:hypothetical protein
MKRYIRQEEQEAVLAQWCGTRAKIWLFHVSHNRMAIHLVRKGEREGIYIIAVGCERFVGPFSWDQANIIVVTEPPNQWGEVRRRIMDKQAGFEVLCSDVVIAHGPAAVPEDPFDNFLVDK